MWLEITTTSPCINKCTYCPQALLASVYKGDKMLSLANFKRALANVDKEIDIHFSGFSEPFGNPKCVDMILYAYDKGHNISLFTTLNGLKRGEELNRVHFKYVRIHDIGQKKQNYKWADNFSKVETVVSRAGNLFTQPKREVRMCGRSENYTQNVMLPNGDIYLCCQDYGLKHKLGNIFETNFRNLKRKNEPYELCSTCEYAI